MSRLNVEEMSLLKRFGVEAEVNKLFLCLQKDSLKKIILNK